MTCRSYKNRNLKQPQSALLKMDIYPEEIYNDPIFDGTWTLCKFRGAWFPWRLVPDEQKMMNILNMSVRPSDLFVLSYPKSGTTWMQEVVWKIASIHRPELCASAESCKNKTFTNKFPMLEDPIADIDEINNMASPRCFKYHGPYHLLPKQALQKSPKMIYIARDPRDSAVSYYHFLSFLKGVECKGTLEDFYKLFLEDKFDFCPWLDHVREFWMRRDEPNILFVTYENKKRHPDREILRVAKFLDIELTAEDLEQVVKATSFKVMQENSSANWSWCKDIGIMHSDANVLRKGIIGDWKNNMSQETSDAFYEKFIIPMKELGLNFDES